MISNSTLEVTSRRIAELLGLNFPKNRWNDLKRGLISAAKELGHKENAEHIARWLEQREFSNLELEVLTNYLTVGETYFFRDQSILDVFQKNIIPEILTQRFGKSQHIKIWSAGCCSGEEPYTLAILLLETIPDIQNWKISILGTDINRNFLKKATDGIYSSWSFRETPEKLRDKYFRKVSNGWSIAPEIKNMVRFDYLNLCEDSYPSAQSQTESLDIIFCRNVLMYFSQELNMAIGQRFYKALTQGGWFITSPVELSDENFSSFAKIHYEKSIVYQKSEKKIRPIALPTMTHETENRFDKLKQQSKAGKSTIPQSPSNVFKSKNIALATDPFDQARQQFNAKQYQKCVDYCSNEIKKVSNPLPWLVLLVKAYANLRQHDKALTWGAQLLKLDGMNVEVYYLSPPFRLKIMP
jgi:chemotaxis protein methyltransferase CheR